MRAADRAGRALRRAGGHLGRIDRAQASKPVDVASLNHWARTNALFDRHIAPAPMRPHYLWCLLHVAGIARHLGYRRVAALEFGCAGGNGLIALEAVAPIVEAEFGVALELHGFDGGVGMPPPEGPDDAPYLIEPGHFPMDVDALRARLTRTHLHLGPVGESVAAFLAAPAAPVGFVVQDLDYWSSTRDALALFDAPAERFLPRVLSYYDDVLGYPWAAGNGERRANVEFNAAHRDRRIDELRGMAHLVPAAHRHDPWPHALHLVHLHDHPRYAEYEGTAISTRLDLAPR